MRTGPLVFLVALIVSPIALPDPLRLGGGLAWALPAILVALVVCAWEVARGRWPATPLDPFLGAFAMCLVVSAAFGVNHWESLKASLVVVGNFGAFYAAAVAARRRRGIGALLAVVVVGAAIVELMALWYHLDVGLAERPTAYSSPPGWSGYPELGVLGVIQVAVLAGAFVAAPKRLERAAIAVVIALAVAEIVLLYSRAAWVAAAVVVGLALAINQQQRARTLVIAGVIAALGLSASLTLRPVRDLASNLIGMTPSDRGTVNMAAPSSRVDLWTKTLAMIGDSPLTGVGPGNFRQIFETRYNPELNNDNRRGVHAHNLWLQQTAELGIPGGLVLAALWGAGVWTAWQAVRVQRTAVTCAVFLSLAAATMSNLTDSVPSEVAGARLYLLTWIMFGVAAGLREGERVRG